MSQSRKPRDVSSDLPAMSEHDGPYESLRPHLVRTQRLIGTTRPRVARNTHFREPTTDRNHLTSAVVGAKDCDHTQPVSREPP